MADYPILTSPDGSTSFNIGSVMLADGVDYGMAGMFPNSIGGNALTDGGALGAKWNPPRMFKFPIRLATVGALTPAGVSNAIRQMAQNGAWIDLMLAGVATADAVRFDVIDGRVRESQDVKMWQGARRRDAVVELDVQPLGYLPTWITLASSASVGLPGTLAIPGASILGDAPGLAKINVFAYVPSQQLGAAATYGYDSFYYALANKAPAFIPAASMSGSGQLGLGMAATLTGDAAAPGSQVQRVFMTPSVSPLYQLQPGFQPLFVTEMTPTYVGRYRLHALARNVAPSTGVSISLAAEVSVQHFGGGTGFASGGLVASIGQPLTLASDGAYMPVPTGFGFYPLGDITVPPVATVTQQSIVLWGVAPTLGLGTYTLDVAGLWLQSLDGAQGIVTRDLQLAAPLSAATHYNPYPFSIDAARREVSIHTVGNSLPAPATMQLIALSSQLSGRSIIDRYRGPFPQVSPSMVSIELMMGARLSRRSYAQEVMIDTPKVWWRFNEPSGASVVLDYSGNGVNGAASNMLLGASSLLYGEPGGATVVTGYAFASAGGIPAANVPRTLEAWYQPATYATTETVAALGASNLAGGVFGISFLPTAIVAYSWAANASWPYAWVPGKTYHLAAAYSGTHVTMYVNGQALTPTQTFPALLTNLARLSVGQHPVPAGEQARGGIDEVAVYASALSADRILAHYIAGRNTMGATSPPVYQKNGYAGISVRYRPQFTFSKEL